MNSTMNSPGLAMNFTGNSPKRGMAPTEKLGLILSIPAIIGLFLSLPKVLRKLIPFYIIPPLSARLDTARELCNQAEASNAIPPGSDERTCLNRLENQFAAMCAESNEAQWPLRAVTWPGLTYRLYLLYFRIERVRFKLELAIYRQQPRTAESATETAPVVPSPAAATATPGNDAVDPTLPPPVTSS